LMAELSSSARRVQDALAALGLPLEVVEFPQSTRTAAEAASAVGCDVGQIVKSLVFRGRDTGRCVLVLASGANRVDETKAAAVLGEGIERATPEFVRERTGYAIGGVPPIGHASQSVTLIDADLLAYEVIWAAAGTPNAVFRLTPHDLVRMSGGTIADVKVS
jgi:prolyl-tRNA editing enzyme YbaK/EbsC (Cys-tRNA(Pro) deacylase)